MSEQIRILRMIETGELSPEEGAKLIREANSKGQIPESETNFMEILERIEKGELSPDDGIAWLHQDSTQENPAEGIGFVANDTESHQQPALPESEIDRWKKWWTYPMYLGIGIVVLSAFWMNSSYQNSGYGFWFFCAWLPLGLGILLISLSWLSQKGPWIHVRVKGKENVAVSMPAPLGLAGWGLRNFGHFIPNLERTSVDEIITALEQSVKSDEPLYISVDDQEDGEHVEVFIG